MSLSHTRTHPHPHGLAQVPLKAATTVHEDAVHALVGASSSAPTYTLRSQTLCLARTSTRSSPEGDITVATPPRDEDEGSGCARSSAPATVVPVRLTPLVYGRLAGAAADAPAYGCMPAHSSKAALPPSGGDGLSGTLPVARAWPLHTALDWSELEWCAEGVTIRRVFYPLHAVRTLTNNRFLRPPPAAGLPWYDVRTDAVAAAPAAPPPPPLLAPVAIAATASSSRALAT